MVFCTTYALILPAITMEKTPCEIPEHTHTEACYSRVTSVSRRVPACSAERLGLHVHGESCLDENGTITCGYADFVVHTHDASCYDADGALWCPLPEIPLHTHTDACWAELSDGPVLICEQPEIVLHEHTADCSDADGHLICGKLQVTEHIHTDACFETVEEPADCEVLTCGMEEHTHSDSCRAAVTELAFTGSDFTVTVRCDSGALPEGITLSVREIPIGSDEYRSYCTQAAEAVNADQDSADTIVFARFFDIGFMLDGQKFEPTVPVEVTITYAEAVETGADAESQAVHFGANGIEVLDAAAERKEDGSTSFTHTQEGFSVVGNVVTTANAADIGPKSLRVDYYVCIDGSWICVGFTKTGWYAHPSDPLTDYNRDYITVEQAASILGAYGFSGEEANPARLIAYQQKTGHLNIYSDTKTVTVDSQAIIPLSRNMDHAGYNLYYLPGNSAVISGYGSTDSLDKAANGFYNVKVYDAAASLLTSALVRSGGSFTYDQAGSWLITYGSGSTATVNGTVNLTDITSPVVISPKQTEDTMVNHTVTFKVMVDGQWTTAGSLPHYYTGTVNGTQRAYIPSGEAAQILGKFGYTAGTNPGYHFGSGYADIYTIFYASNTNYCMDISGNKLADGTVIQLWTSNNSTAQIFRIRDAGDGYSFISPVGDSSLYVNVYGGGSDNRTALKLSTATDDGSKWRLETNADGTTTFWSANAPASALIDLDGGKTANGTPIQIWNKGGNRYWKLAHRISNDAGAEEIGSGWKIGLTEKSDGDIVCYYLPAETTAAYNNTPEILLSAGNTFWSVKVTDDTHSVYADAALQELVQYVPNGGSATVTVRNAQGILWSCAGKHGLQPTVASDQSGGNTIFTITDIRQPIEVVATKADPTFTVQYYANIPRYATSGDHPLTVIDTSAAANNGTAKLPTNGGSMPTRFLYLESTGSNTDQNAGNATPLYRVKTVTELTKMYTESAFHYLSSPSLNYFNKLKNNEDYVLAELWVLKTGRDGSSVTRSDWDIYTYRAGSTEFTNEAGQAIGDTILIADGAVLRLVFNASTGEYTNGTTFYDYNISSGQNADGRWRTGITGINKESNYGTSLNGERTWRSGADILAFGNANCGTGMSGYLFDKSTLNKHSSKNSGYGGTTFGLAAGLNPDGTIRYNDWVVAPKLFNEKGDVNGKQTYAGSSLTFSRVGDTYTLSAATLANSNGQKNKLPDLQYFFNPSPTSATTHTHIFTNNFWPMDPAAGRTDALWGAYGNTGTFQGFDETNNYQWSDLAGSFPPGDDGRAHNWFFGMNFSLSFTLTADYEGPLEYYFFGDDDLWVFLDNKLVCDIGGVHSSVGEYVNLRDYLPAGSAGQHTLSFFYTERGASGSTCYMSFTLPSVTSPVSSQDTGSLVITKQVVNTGGKDYSQEKYRFRVELLTEEGGADLNQTFSYALSDGTFGNVRSGGTIVLHQNETATVQGIPAGTYYRVTEVFLDSNDQEIDNQNDYDITVNGNVGHIVSGTAASGVKHPAAFVNIVRTYSLPATGGAGTTAYTLGGMLLIAAALLLLYIHIRRGKEDLPSS